MTRARSHTWAVGISPLIQPLLEAVLCVVMSLVQGVATTFGMRFNRRPRDWHTDETREALPQTKPDIHIKEALTPTDPSIRLPRAGGDPASAGSALPTRTLQPVIPAEARKRGLSRLGAAKAEKLKTRSHAHKRQHAPPLASSSRKRASGMTDRVSLQTA